MVITINKSEIGDDDDDDGGGGGGDGVGDGGPKNIYKSRN